MWATVAGILGVSVVLACVDTLYKELRKRPPPPDRIESESYKAPEAEVKAARAKQQSSSFAREMYRRMMKFKK